MVGVFVARLPEYGSGHCGGMHFVLNLFVVRGVRADAISTMLDASKVFVFLLLATLIRLMLGLSPDELGWRVF